MSIGINSMSTSPADMFSVTSSPVTVDTAVHAATRDVPKVEEQSKNNTQAAPEKQVSKDDLINMSTIFPVGVLQVSAIINQLYREAAFFLLAIPEYQIQIQRFFLEIVMP